jgi:hypothetical protein
MNPLKALIIKDFQANKKMLMMPIWYLLGSYVIMIASMIFASMNGDKNVTISGIPLELLANNNLHMIMSFGIQAAMFFGFMGFIFAISMSATSSTMLNQDIKHKCELFHRSQPVSIWKITGSRFIAGVGGQLALALVIGVINMILSIIVISMTTPMRIDLWMSLNGFLLSWMHFSIALLVLGSILFLASSIFKDNAFGITIGGFGALQIVAFFLNKIYHWNIPYILNAIYKLIMSGILNIQKVIPTMQQFGLVSINHKNGPGTGPDLSGFVIPHSFLYNMWSTLFTWDIALKLVLCAAMFVIATCIYHRREVQF